jgi:hypothetical protein
MCLKITCKILEVNSYEHETMLKFVVMSDKFNISRKVIK